MWFRDSLCTLFSWPDHTEHWLTSNTWESWRIQFHCTDSLSDWPACPGKGNVKGSRQGKEKNFHPRYSRVLLGFLSLSPVLFESLSQARSRCSRIKVSRWMKNGSIEKCIQYLWTTQLEFISWVRASTHASFIHWRVCVCIFNLNASKKTPCFSGSKQSWILSHSLSFFSIPGLVCCQACILGCAALGPSQRKRDSRAIYSGVPCQRMGTLPRWRMDSARHNLIPFGSPSSWRVLMTQRRRGGRRGRNYSSKRQTLDSWTWQQQTTKCAGA